MLDLKLLEESFNTLFENETVESFNAWLISDRISRVKCNIQRIYGGGEFEDIILPYEQIVKASLTKHLLSPFKLLSLMNRNTT